MQIFMQSISNLIRSNAKIVYSSIAVFIAALSLKLLFRENLYGQTLTLIFLFTAVFFSWHNLNSDSFKKYARGTLIGLSALMAALLLLHTFEAARSNAVWDFLPFYLNGLIGKYDLPFYDPNSLSILLDRIDFQFEMTQDLQKEVFTSGMLYPPTSMLIFAPLTLFNYETSRVINSVIIFIFILSDTFLLYKLSFRKDKSFYGFITIFIIVMILPGTRSTIMYNQTNFFLLFFLLLMLLNITKSYSGIFHAFTILFKPITIILALHSLILKKWKSLFNLALTGMVFIIITGLVWSFKDIADFFITPPTSRYNFDVLAEPINQSLLSIIYKTLIGNGFAQSAIQWSYYIISIVILSVTILASMIMSKLDYKISLLPFIPAMLIVYPSSLSHYSVYLLPIIIMFILNKKFSKYFWIMILPAALFLYLIPFLSNVIIWSVLIYFGLSYRLASVNLKN